uniref:Laminin alpha chain (inferred by orthology to a C. elegans protein) n=1 Tax=Anisakis simplex TaxID=6269 RepID=A0A0M3K8A8_ANISI
LFRKALELVKKITSHKLNDTTFENLKERLNEFRQWIEDYRDTIWDSARQDTVSANKIATVVAKRIDRFNEVASSIAEILAKSNDEIAEAEDRVITAKTEKILNIYDDAKHINETLLPALRIGIDKCQNEADKYAQLLGEYRREYVDASAKHSKELADEAQRLQGYFVDTKLAAENAIKASNSYKEIVEALKNASRAAEEAKKAAEDAYIDADPTSDTSMVNLASEAKNASIKLRMESDELSLDDLQEERDSCEDRLVTMKDFIDGAIKKKTAVGDQYQIFDDQHDRMTGLVNVAADAEERAEDAHNKAEELVAQIAEIDEETAKLKDFAGQSIRDATDSVREANDELKSAMEKVENVRAQTDSDAERIIDLGIRIDELKNKIKEAREMASRIRISVKSDETGLCRRSFISPMHPSPSNTITVKYRPAIDVPDSLIFLTRTKSKRTQASEYIALELRDRRVVAHWNIGGETRMVTNTHPVNYITIADRDTWYNIHLDRLSFDFRTRGANATLIYQSSKVANVGRRRQKRAADGEGYFAFYLYRGYLVVHLGTDASQRSKVLTLRSESTYNDGQLHSVFLSREGSLVRLRVDDREIASGTLADQAMIGTINSQIFIGGFPPSVKPPSNELPADDPLIGCVSDIYSEYKVVQIVPDAYFATIGYCAAEYVFETSQSADEPLQADEHAFERKASRLSLHITEPTLSTASDQYFYIGGI